MKVGDKVKVTELVLYDSKETNLGIGTIGVITRVVGDTFIVDFGEEFKCGSSANYFSDGYMMYASQLEKVQEDKYE